MKLKRVLTATVLVGMMASNTSMVFANTAATAQTIEKQASVVTNTTELRYSDFLKNGEVWVDLDLQGATFAADATANEIRDAITTNYEVDTTLAVRRDRTGIEFGVYAARPNVSFKDEWVITIDKSVLSVDYDLEATIKVRDNVTAMPKVTADKTSLTRAELVKGAYVTFKIDGAKFNTACNGQYIRRCVQNASSTGNIYAVPFCNFSQDEITFYIRALNGVSIHQNSLRIEFDQLATSSNSVLPVTIFLS